MTNPTLESALDQAIAKLGADSGTIHVKEPGRKVLQLAASKDIPESILNIVREIPWGKGMAGLAAERAEPMNFCNIQKATSPEIHPRARAAGVRGAIVVPMMNGLEVVGTIGVGCRTERNFSNTDLAWLRDLGRRLASGYGENRLAA